LRRLEISKVYTPSYKSQGTFADTKGLGTISNELFQVTNLALLCEDIVSGMIAANEYRETTQGKIPSTPSDEVFSPSHTETPNIQRPPLDIILDIEHRDWDFRIQTGNFDSVLTP
jgi:hypothetical protein